MPNFMVFPMVGLLKTYSIADGEAGCDWVLERAVALYGFLINNAMLKEPDKWLDIAGKPRRDLDLRESDVTNDARVLFRAGVISKWLEGNDRRDKLVPNIRELDRGLSELKQFGFVKCRSRKMKGKIVDPKQLEPVAE